MCCTGQVLHLHSGAQGKRKEVETDPKVGQAEAQEVMSASGGSPCPVRIVSSFSQNRQPNPTVTVTVHSTTDHSLLQVKRRSDTVTYAMLAEVNTFHEQRVKDVKSSHQHFLQEQIKFYQKVTTVAAWSV